MDTIPYGETKIGLIQRGQVQLVISFEKIKPSVVDLKPWEPFSLTQNSAFPKTTNVKYNCMTDP